MQVEALVTALGGSLRYHRGEDKQVYCLDGIFQSLRLPPARFVVYVDLLRGAVDVASLRLRPRRGGIEPHTIYESVEELVLAYEMPSFATAFAIEDVELPPGLVILEVLIDGRIAASRLLSFGYEEEPQS